MTADGLVERAWVRGPDADAWRRWGPYLSERAWGTVREDYSPDGRAWEYLPHDHARSRNAGPDEDILQVLPTLWFRNTWSWNGGDDHRPHMSARATSIVTGHPELGRMVLAGDGEPDLLFCDNETNTGRLWGCPRTPSRHSATSGLTAIGESVVEHRAQRVRPNHPPSNPKTATALMPSTGLCRTGPDRTALMPVRELSGGTCSA